MIPRIDAWLIDRFERFSHWTQVWFGLTSATWERLCAIMCGAFIVCMEGPRDWGKIEIIFDGLILGGCVVRFLWSFDRATGEFMNPQKMTGQYTRPLTLVLGLISLYPDLFIRHSLWFQFSVCGYYFGACDDLPLGPSKVRKALDSIKSWGHSQQPQTA